MPVGRCRCGRTWPRTPVPPRQRCPRRYRPLRPCPAFTGGDALEEQQRDGNKQDAVHDGQQDEPVGGVLLGGNGLCACSLAIGAGGGQSALPVGAGNVLLDTKIENYLSNSERDFVFKTPNRHPSATSSTIITLKPTAKNTVPTLECCPCDISGISSSTTTYSMAPAAKLSR